MKAREDARATLVDGVRSALFHTLPGRAIVTGVAIKIVISAIRAVAGGIPAFLGVVETVAGLAVAAGLSYYAFRLIVVAKRRLLWRVRRKLILSYVFVGFVPALLLVAFALLCGFLFFYNLGSYLVRNRLEVLADKAGYVAQSTALEIQRAGPRDLAVIAARRQAAAATEYPDASMAIVSIERSCEPGQETPSKPAGTPIVAGPWTHVEPPKTIPAWISCVGFNGVLAYSHSRVANAPDADTHLLVRAVAF